MRWWKQIVGKNPFFVIHILSLNILCVSYDKRHKTIKCVFLNRNFRFFPPQKYLPRFFLIGDWIYFFKSLSKNPDDRRLVDSNRKCDFPIVWAFLSFQIGFENWTYLINTFALTMIDDERWANINIVQLKIKKLDQHCFRI